jgi:hypothetical protein
MPLLAYTCVFANVADEFLLKNSTIKMVKIDIKIINILYT